MMGRVFKLALVMIGVAAFSVMAQTPQGKQTKFEPREFVVFFPTQSAELPPMADQVVAAAARYASQGARRIIVYGHTDTAEGESMQLSRRRAHSVGDSLYRHALPESVQVVETGLGMSDLAVPTGPKVSEPLNRRVTLDIT